MYVLFLRTTALVFSSTAGFGISGMEAKYVEYFKVVKDVEDESLDKFIPDTDGERALVVALYHRFQNSKFQS